MKTLIQTTVIILLLASPAAAKRIAPKEVPPVKTGKCVISVPHFPKGKRAQNGGVLEAHHPKTKKLLWRIQVYETAYEEALEKDVQDVFIKSLSFDKTHNLLILSDEAGRIFVLDLQSKKVTQIENSAEQDGADQPATAPQSRPEGKEKPRPESDGRSK
jgi:hypothetical protein